MASLSLLSFAADERRRRALRPQRDEGGDGGLQVKARAEVRGREGVQVAVRLAGRAGLQLRDGRDLPEGGGDRPGPAGRPRRAAAAALHEGGRAAVRGDAEVSDHCPRREHGLQSQHDGRNHLGFWLNQKGAGRLQAAGEGGARRGAGEDAARCRRQARCQGALRRECLRRGILAAHCRFVGSKQYQPFLN